MSVSLLTFREQGLLVGEVLEKHLEQIGMSQVELSRRTGITTKHINRIIKGKSGFSADVAIKLEYATKIKAAFWLECLGQDLLKQAKELWV